LLNTKVLQFALTKLVSGDTERTGTNNVELLELDLDTKLSTFDENSSMRLRS